jgi:pyrroloquinoline quinone (PQQ) biosynthesis protein C
LYYGQIKASLSFFFSHKNATLKHATEALKKGLSPNLPQKIKKRIGCYFDQTTDHSF